MGQFVPKFIASESWDQMLPQNVYAIKMSLDNPVRMRFGLGIGVYVEMSKSSNGHVINMLDFETGDPTLAGNLPPDTLVTLGRTSECQVKITQPVISRQHVELKVWEQKILIAKDLGSTNGSFLWNELPMVNLTGLTDDAELSEMLEKKFGIDITPLLNEYSQSKGS